MTVSASEIVSIVVLIISLISVRGYLLKGLNLGEEILNLRLHSSFGLIGGCKFSCVLGSGGCTFVFVNLESCHHLIYDGVGVMVMESKFVDCSASLSELKVSLSEIVLEISPSLVHRIGAFPPTDVVFANSLFL